MKTNVEKVLERDQKLSELDDRADALQQGASQFEQQAGKLKRKFWLQNLKVCICQKLVGVNRLTSVMQTVLFVIFGFQMMIIMGVIGLVIVGILVCKYSVDLNVLCQQNRQQQQDPLQLLTDLASDHIGRCRCERDI